MNLSPDDRMKFLVNPLSRKSHQVIGQIEQTLTSWGLTSPDDYHIELTNPADLPNQVITACQSYGKIVAVGGDGTVGQVIGGIVQSGTKRRLGVIPLGTANDLSRTVGLYREFHRRGLEGLLKIILRGRVINLDVLSLNDKFIFSNYFSLGLDARICRDFNLLRSKIPKWISGSRINKLFYIWLGLKNLRYCGTGGFSLTIRLNDGQEKAIIINPKSEIRMSTIRNPQSGIRAIIISNIKDYAAGSPLSRQAEISDGKFEVTIIKNLVDFIQLLVARFFPLKREIEQYQTTWVKIEGRPGGYFQLDGEDFSTTLSNKNVFEVKVYTTIPLIR